MNKTKEIMLGVSAGFAALTSFLGILAIPVYMLVIFNITDYCTGIMAAKYRNEHVNSYKGFRGICKKVCMLILVAIGGVMDWILMFVGENILGMAVIFRFYIASLVAIWLILNEIVSILENIKDIGTPLPPFLVKLVQNVKSKVEQKGAEEDENLTPKSSTQEAPPDTQGKTKEE